MQSDKIATTSGEPSVVIVLLNWNNAQPTLDCLNALRRLDYANARIVVVDNGSAAANLQPLMALRDIELLRNEVNLGFAGGANTGLRHAFTTGARICWFSTTMPFRRPMR